MIRFIPTFILICSSILLSSCKNNPNSVEANEFINTLQESHVVDSIPYNLDNPTSLFKLERDLYEISGLAYLPSRDLLLAINDEKGRVFLVSPNSGKIEEKIDFKKSNDYEGVAYSNEMIYVVESNGDIIIVDENQAKKIDSYKTKLTRKNDIEGITYNPSTGTFLLAAKGRGNIKGKKKKKKAIFTLDPIMKKVSEIPFFTIDIKEVKDNFRASNSFNGLGLTNNRMSRIDKFSPSGIAVHPTSNEIYVLSSRGKLLLTFDQKGNLQYTYFLNEKLNLQPEGICFGPDLTLYISNEGRAGKGNIQSFKYQK